MEKPNELPPAAQSLFEHGAKLKVEVMRLLKSWPRGKKGDSSYTLSLSQCPPDHRTLVEQLATNAARWFNTIGKDVLPHTLEDPRTLYVASRRVQAGIRKQFFYRPPRDKSTVTFQSANPVQSYIHLLRPKEGDQDEDTTIDQALLKLAQAWRSLSPS
jgi:hypothetical protein